MSHLPESQRPAFVGTFHQLGWTWHVEPGDAPDQEFWETAAPERMRAAATALPDDQRFTAFVVDEAQDFADSWWPALLASGAGPDCRLAVFRDDEQAVFSKRRGRPDRTLVPFHLDANLRNARQIVDTFRPLIHADVMVSGGDNPTGNVCEALHWHGYIGMEREAVDLIAEWIKRPVN